MRNLFTYLIAATTALSSLAAAVVLPPPIAQSVASPTEYIANVGNGLRLIQTSETELKWMTDEQVLTELIQKKLKFMDVTFSTIKDKSTSSDGARVGDSTLAAAAIPSGPTKQSIVKPLLSSISTSNLQSRLTTLASYTNRYYTTTNGKNAAQWVYDTLLAIKGADSTHEVVKFTHSWAQFSVIARIKGTGSTASELVIAGAHLDSINQNNPTTGVAPGADDDGSGVTVLFESWRILTSSGYKPSRTIEFHFYSGEEGGLLGSQAIAGNYQSASKVVAGMLQLDMAGYVPSPSRVSMGIVTDYVSATLNTFLKSVATAYVNIPRKEYKCGYACSDHASWYRAGYPAVYPGETIDDGNPYIHTSSDTLSRVNYTYMAEHVRVVLGFTVELS
ncbi:hypothetical protein BJ742DRAFT_293251 [Cladochytrium replicatum]|nr:hypothetical protein BJ742DRAFT_293251 [Cladochytrium replicatum]